MWYEILPVFTIIGAALAIPNAGAYFFNKIFLGQPYPRNVDSYAELHMFSRDVRISKRGFAYDYHGLENIPDADENNEEKPKDKL